MNINRPDLDLVFKDSFLLIGHTVQIPSSFSEDTAEATAIAESVWRVLMKGIMDAREAPPLEMIPATSPADCFKAPQIIDYFAGSTFNVENFKTLAIASGNYLR